jgi:hypothetical protein
MALVLIKEDGTGKLDANSYADSTDGDAYFDGHLYASGWTAATTGSKEKALVFATRLIDTQFQFNGWRTTEEQALQWPRDNCPDPDKGLPLAIVVLRLRSANLVDANVVPRAVVNATCEMARELLIVDRTASPAGEGIQTSINAGVTTKYSKTDTRPIISYVAQAMLAKYGGLVSEGSGAVRLIRG